jgi:hypothetical protein
MGWNNEISYVAAGDLKRGRAVKSNKTLRQVVQASVAGEKVVGFTPMGSKRNLPGSDETIAYESGDKGVRVIGQGNDGLVESGGSFSADAELTTDSSGRAVVSTTDGDWIFAKALQASTGSGQFVMAQACGYYKVGTAS